MRSKPILVNTMNYQSILPRLVHNPISVGIVPVRRFKESTRWTVERLIAGKCAGTTKQERTNISQDLPISFQFPISFGIGPVNVFESTKKSSKDYSSIHSFEDEGG
jgi:hypothetical protein